MRRLLARRGEVVEKRTVGGLSFLVGGSLCCGVTGSALLVRLGPEGSTAALAEPHVRPMAFAGRRLRGFVCVDPPGFKTADGLARWVGRGLAFVATLPVKKRPR